MSMKKPWEPWVEPQQHIEKKIDVSQEHQYFALNWSILMQKPANYGC
jgi:hypothetical protein